MSVYLSPLGGAGWQFLDNNGNPLAGGLIYTYAGGTTTPVSTYTSSTGGTANANPIVLDSAGRTPAQIWLTEGSSYKFVLQTSAGVTIKTDDNIFASYELNLTGVANTQVLYVNSSGVAEGSGDFTWDGNDLSVKLIEIGYGAGSINTNTKVGRTSLSANISGSNLTAIGYKTLDANTTGANNTSVGSESLSANTTGQNNSAFGKSALAANTIGQGNTAIGANSLLACSTGNYNTVVGHDSGNSITTGQGNVVVGYLALDVCQTGNYNIAIGNQALRDIVSSNNVAVGDGSLLLAAGTAANNTAIGYSAGANLTSGSNNTVIGYNANVSAGGVSNEITLGNSSITSMRVPGLTMTVGPKWINNGTQTVAALVAAGTAGAGARAVVTDANATTFHSIVVGGGANVVPVFSDGTNWRIG